ncbi:uncharacterized protein [Rutidosis leptorrhynchoides]|uniref:uncharacterized protein n=1 Tax=Rutidosis leptorrhynchoides TaxID=125765 RepID=UPI003A98D632
MDDSMDDSWTIRTSETDQKAIDQLYDVYPDLFTIVLHHGGYFRMGSEVVYTEGKIDYIDCFDIEKFCLGQLDSVMQELGYDPTRSVVYRFLKPNTNMDTGLNLLNDNEHRDYLLSCLEDGDVIYRQIDVYAEHEDIKGKRLWSEQINNDNLVVGGVHSDGSLVEGDNSEGSDSEDSDYIVDDENEILDVHVEMKDFNFNIDKNVEFMGNGCNSFEDDEVNIEGTELEVLNNDGFESYDSQSDEEGVRKKRIRNHKKEVEGSVQVGKTIFYLGQKFESKSEVRQAVRMHAIETRRKLVIVKNDKRRIRVKCEGLCINSKGGEIVSQSDLSKKTKCDVGPSNLRVKGGVVGKSKDKVTSQIKKAGESCSGKTNKWAKRELHIVCEWVLLVSKEKDSEEWEVRTYRHQHECQPARILKFCTYQFLSNRLVPQIQKNPKIPIKAVRSYLETETELIISEHKAYRAVRKATKMIQGDYKSQYAELRDYVCELKRGNVDTTVKFEVEPGTLKSETRVFKRIYICLGPLKKGFKAIGRDLLGLDGAFMKQPATGCILSAVGVDSNNGIYPVAYAIVEQECGSSWTWFLECLGQDLDLSTNSNFNFISDRQKGLIQAVTNVFPCAEHRHCLRHIHGNMKGDFRGVAYKNHLWRCASVTTVPEFEQAMQQLKEFDNEAFVWLAKIPAHQWARSHFTGRAVSDVLLSNMCECFNRWLVDARDKPIVTALEYIREYCMKRIVNVKKNISKTNGPLTPAATKLFEKIKSEAHQCTVLWGGDQRYQVSGKVNQYVVDMETRSCACRKWELTGIPCKHAIAVFYNMSENGLETGEPETWVHPVYLLDTWIKTYQYTIEPLNGRSLWPKAEGMFTLVSPKTISTPGRPKKKRRLSKNEVDVIGDSGKLSSKGKLKKCGTCGTYGHNMSTCTGEKKRSGNVDNKWTKKTVKVKLSSKKTMVVGKGKKKK